MKFKNSVVGVLSLNTLFLSMSKEEKRMILRRLFLSNDFRQRMERNTACKDVIAFVGQVVLH